MRCAFRRVRRHTTRRKAGARRSAGSDCFSKKSGRLETGTIASCRCWPLRTWRLRPKTGPPRPRWPGVPSPTSAVHESIWVDSEATSAAKGGEPLPRAEAAGENRSHPEPIEGSQVAVIPIDVHGRSVLVQLWTHRDASQIERPRCLPKPPGRPGVPGRVWCLTGHCSNEGCARWWRLFTNRAKPKRNGWRKPKARRRE